MKLNMIASKPSRKKPVPGDIFTFNFQSKDVFRFGRVIRTDSVIGGIENMLLLT